VGQGKYACAGSFSRTRTTYRAARSWLIWKGLGRPSPLTRSVHETGADGCLAIGGGSTIGLGKAITLDAGLPLVCVPTIYAGSEMTPVRGLTENGRKRTGRDPAVLPRSVIYDPDLTPHLPVDTSVTIGFNAIAHAVEAL
jgi:maleylacetate reductase